MSHDGARTDSCNRCDKLRGFLLNSLALVSFRRARKGVVRAQSACARHLEVTTGRADGGEGSGRKEGSASGWMEHEDEEGTDEQGWEERKIPGYEVRLACVQVSLKRTSADD